jgi:hypothetical protein
MRLDWRRRACASSQWVASVSIEGSVSIEAPLSQPPVRLLLSVSRECSRTPTEITTLGDKPVLETGFSPRVAAEPSLDRDVRQREQFQHRQSVAIKNARM